METTFVEEPQLPDEWRTRDGQWPRSTRSVFNETFLADATDVTEVLLVRHGQQDYEPDGPVGAITDAPLSELGRAQVELVAAHLAGPPVDAVYASPLQRALDTGRAIARYHGISPVVLTDLREIGIFRDVPPNETAATFLGPRVLATARERMLTERCWDAFPCTEPSMEFRIRVVGVIELILSAHRGGRIVVACHGGVINAYAASLIASPYDMFFQPAHTSISIIAAGHGRRAIRTLNDTRHLHDAGVPATV